MMVTALENIEKGGNETAAAAAEAAAAEEKPSDQYEKDLKLNHKVC